MLDKIEILDTVFKDFFSTHSTTKIKFLKLERFDPYTHNLYKHLDILFIQSNYFLQNFGINDEKFLLFQI